MRNSRKMKKVYEPLNMIMNGRYAVLYGKLAPAIQQEILVRMAELISTHMWAALTAATYQKLSRIPFFLPVMRKIIPLGFKYGSGKGWKYVWHPEDPKDIYHFETLECLYKHIFSKYGVLERFGTMFCRCDIINYGNLHNIDFIRTRTLCQGDDCCDFCFVRHRRGDVWERTKSI